MTKVVINQVGVSQLLIELDKFTEKVTNEAVGVSKELCPVDTGNLRDSIGYIKNSKGEYSYGSSLEYALIVEFGSRYQSPQPYLRPSIMTVKQKYT